MKKIYETCCSFLEPWLCAAACCLFSIIASDITNSGPLLVITPIALFSFMLHQPTIIVLIPFLFFISIESALAFNDCCVVFIWVIPLLCAGLVTSHYIVKKKFLIIGYTLGLIAAEKSIRAYYGTLAPYTFFKIVSTLIAISIFLKWFPLVKRGNRS